MKKDPLNIPNCNFSCLSSFDKKDPEDKKRLEEFKKQRIERGFDETECWNLCYTIAGFILPRLKEFRKDMIAYPGVPPMDTMEAWEDAIDEMIYAFDHIVNEDKYFDEIREADKSDPHHRMSFNEAFNAMYDRVQEGLALFAKYFQCLWN